MNSRVFMKLHNQNLSFASFITLSKSALYVGMTRDILERLKNHVRLLITPLKRSFKTHRNVAGAMLFITLKFPILAVPLIERVLYLLLDKDYYVSPSNSGIISEIKKIMENIKYTNGMQANVYIFFWNSDHITLIQTLDSSMKRYLKNCDKHKRKDTAIREL